MDISEIPTSDKRWSEFVRTHPDATPFHLPEWTDLIAECYGFKSFVLAAIGQDGSLLAGVPTVAARSPLGSLRWVSLPFSDSCPLLALAHVDRTELTTAISDYVLDGPASGLEIRTPLPQGTNVHPVVVGYNHTIELPSDPALLHPNKGHRYSRNRARRKGVVVVRGTAKEDVGTFYRLHTLTRRRHGVPVQPRRFFDMLWDRLVRTGHGFVSTALHDGQVLAAGIYLGHNGTLVAKYYASDPAAPDLGAGYLIDWETMAAACAEGYHRLELGRSDLDAEGLRLYKSSWGSVESELVYTHVSEYAPGSTSLGLGSAARGIIRHSPTWVCRGLGELFYRWSA